MNDKIEIPIVTGETKSRERPIVVNIAEKMFKDSARCVPHKEIFTKQARAPIIKLLSIVSITVEHTRSRNVLVLFRNDGLTVPK